MRSSGRVEDDHDSYGRIGTSSPPVVVCGHGRWQGRRRQLAQATEPSTTKYRFHRTQTTVRRSRRVSCAQCQCRERRGLSPNESQTMLIELQREPMGSRRGAGQGPASTGGSYSIISWLFGGFPADRSSTGHRPCRPLDTPAAVMTRFWQMLDTLGTYQPSEWACTRQCVVAVKQFKAVRQPPSTSRRFSRW